MIADLTLRWVVTLLFVFSAGDISFTMLTGRLRWPDQVGQLLHLVMAIAMAVMAWPQGAAGPTMAPMVFFVFAAAWFAVITWTPAGVGRRIADTYHFAMMLAMAWMYAVMDDSLLRSSSGHSAHMQGDTAHMQGDRHMSGHAHDHLHENMSGHMHQSGIDAGTVDPAWITGINALWTVGFALAALFWLYQCVMRRRGELDAVADELSHGRHGVLTQAMMAAGMSIMFGVML